MCHGPLCLPNPTPWQKGKLSLFFVKKKKITRIPAAEMSVGCLHSSLLSTAETEVNQGTVLIMLLVFPYPF